MGMHTFAMTNSTAPSATVMARKMAARRALMENAMASDTTSMMGARTAILMSIMNAIWMLVMSVVSLVTRLDTENLSMLAKEKPCILSKMSLLRLVAKPADAVAAHLPASIPNTSENTDMARSIPP